MWVPPVTLVQRVPRTLAGKNALPGCLGKQLALYWSFRHDLSGLYWVI